MCHGGPERSALLGSGTQATIGLALVRGRRGGSEKPGSRNLRERPCTVRDGGGFRSSDTFQSQPHAYEPGGNSLEDREEAQHPERKWRTKSPLASRERGADQALLHDHLELLRRARR